MFAETSVDPSRKRRRMTTRVYNSAIAQSFRMKVLEERGLTHLLADTASFLNNESTAPPLASNYRLDLSNDELLLVEDAEQDISRISSTCALSGGAAPVNWAVPRGGLSLGTITELTGSAGTGKSQLCMQMLLMAVGPRCAGGGGGKVGVISCGDFPQPRRLRELISNHSMSDEEYKAVSRAYWQRKGINPTPEKNSKNSRSEIRPCPFHCICGADSQPPTNHLHPRGLKHPCMRLWLHMYGAALLDDIDTHTVPARTHTQPAYRRALSSLLEHQHVQAQSGYAYARDSAAAFESIEYSFGQYVHILRAHDAAETEAAVELLGLWAAVDARQAAIVRALNTTSKSKSKAQCGSSCDVDKIDELSTWTSCDEAPFFDCVTKRSLALVIIDDLASLVQFNSSPATPTRTNTSGPARWSSIAYDTLSRSVQYLRALCGTYQAGCVCVWTVADDAHRSDQYYRYTCPVKDAAGVVTTGHVNATATLTSDGSSRVCVDVLGQKCTAARSPHVDELIGAVCEHAYPPVWQCSGKWVRGAVGLPWHNLVNGSIVLTRDVRRDGADASRGWTESNVTYHARDVTSELENRQGTTTLTRMGTNETANLPTSSSSEENKIGTDSLEQPLVPSNQMHALEEVRPAPGISLAKFSTSTDVPKGPVRLAFTLRGGAPKARLAFIDEKGFHVYQSIG